MRAAEPSERQILRFQREASIQGRLEHPAIVPVHEIGRDSDGLPFFVMKKLTGITLAQTGVLSGTANVQATAQFTVQVTDANRQSATRQYMLTVGPPLNLRPVVVGGSQVAAPNAAIPTALQARIVDGQGNPDPVHGIREFVVGTGGIGETTAFTPHATTQLFDSNTFGVLDMTLHAGSYEWQFFPAAGSGGFSDSGAGVCH